MKICIPINENNGMESTVYGHFGSAKNFLVYYTDKESYEVIDNSDSNHVHGQCHPLSSIEGKNFDSNFVGGIGARAIAKLNAQGIRVFQAVDGSVQLNVGMLKKSQLPEMTMDDACAHHNQGAGCKD
jgi:predicted Fe-Mo cluster-binding NifX family protein